MAFKSAATVLQPDLRFSNLFVLDNGSTRLMEFPDHHRTVAEVTITGAAPQEVRDAFDRARSVFLYAYFDYELLVVAELQALGAFELSLRHRLNGHGGASRDTLRNLVDRARKASILPAKAAPGPTIADPVEALIALRNGLSHGTAEIHSPPMALTVSEACAQGIDVVFPA